MAARNTDARRTDARNIAVGGLAAMAAGVGIGRFVYTPILPFMAKALGLLPGPAGLIASANFLGYLLGALAAARGALPGGAQRWFLAALLASALSTGAMGLVSALPFFLLLRFVGGAASAYVLVLASTLVLEHLGRLGRPSLSALHFAGVGTGIALSALLVAGLNALGAGWRAQWLCSGALALCGVAVAAWLARTPHTGGAGCGDAGSGDAGAPPPAALSTPMQTNAPAGGGGPPLRLLTWAYGLFGFGYVITATFISSMVRNLPGLHSIEPVVWLVVGLSAVPSVALWTWAGRRLGTGWAFAIAAAVEAFGVALSVLLPSAAGVLWGAVLLGSTFMGLTALGLVQARGLSPANPRRNLALLTAAFGLGQMIGPTFAGYAYPLTQSFFAPSLVAALALLLAAVLVPKRAA